MSVELTLQFCGFFAATTLTASMLGIAIDRGIRWFDGDREG